MSRRILFTDQEHILDQGKPLWPPRETPGYDEHLAWHALNQLTGSERTVIELRHYGEYTFKEIGKQLGISKQAAHMRYKRAINKLKERLDAAIQ